MKSKGIPFTDGHAVASGKLRQKSVETQPVNSFKLLPWQTLIRTSVITLGLVMGVDYGLTRFLPSASQTAIEVMFASPLGGLYSAVVDGGIGILGVVVLEKLMKSRPVINVSTLWALILCLLLALVLRSWISLPGVFLSQLHQISLVGVLLGVFGKGQRYWR